MRGWNVLLAAGLCTAVPAFAGDADQGAAAFAENCAGCHTIGEHARGPDLAGVFGRVTGMAEGYEHYSDTFLALGAEGHVWDEVALTAFLADPAEYAPGTVMTFPGLSVVDTVVAVIDFLRRQDAPAGDAASAELLAVEGDAELGAFLSSECATCHRRDGAGGDGIPAISGLDRAHLIAELDAFRQGRRPNEAMQVIARRLTDEDIAALAAHYAQLEQ